MSKQNIYSILFCSSVALCAVYWEEIKLSFFSFQTSIVSSESQKNIGRKISGELKLVDTNEFEFDFDSLVDEGAIFFVYNENCPPCNQALKSAKKLIEEGVLGAQEFIPLYFGDEFPVELLNYAPLPSFLIKRSKSDTAFEGVLSPSFFVVDAEGTITHKKVGYGKTTLKNLSEVLRKS